MMGNSTSKKQHRTKELREDINTKSNCQLISENKEIYTPSDEKIEKEEKVMIHDNQWKPIGFKNPKGFCYLNSIIQVLLSCADFRKSIEDHQFDQDSDYEDSLFVNGFFNLIKALTERNIDRVETSLSIVQNNVTESSFGDDVYKCFMNLLTRISNAIKQNTEISIFATEKDDAFFKKAKLKHSGFVFDHFYGQMKFLVICKKCNHVCKISYQLIKSLSLPLPKSETSVPLEKCVELFLSDSNVEIDETLNCKCPNGKTSDLKFTSQITHLPRFLFIYLNRGSFTSNFEKNNTYVTCETSIKLNNTEYKLISVVDHIGNSSGGHYYCASNYNENEWWLFDDEHVTKMRANEAIVTDKTIVFLFKRLERN